MSDNEVRNVLIQGLLQCTPDEDSPLGKNCWKEYTDNSRFLADISVEHLRNDQYSITNNNIELKFNQEYLPQFSLWGTDLPAVTDEHGNICKEIPNQTLVTFAGPVQKVGQTLVGKPELIYVGNENDALISKVKQSDLEFAKVLIAGMITAYFAGYRLFGM
eukprot:TRINITY_DN5501_c0_g2_i1.p1 TRINITY_DN5501_c0_g2~~TRINITY_DN5501_c0_g2_i1.p1  ORF type:complete len:161 (-),score=36.45 TRINITY_DN5501_c0_g2_i1:42-524(-)